MKLRQENIYGGHGDFCYHESKCQLFEADSLYYLDWKPILFKPNSKYGYIASDGRWYGCNFSDQLELCRFVIGENDPEEYGWVKIYKSSYRDLDYYSKRHFVTNEQMNTLIEKGICDEDDRLYNKEQMNDYYLFI